MADEVKLYCSPLTEVHFNCLAWRACESTTLSAILPYSGRSVDPFPSGEKFIRCQLSLSFHVHFWMFIDNLIIKKKQRARLLPSFDFFVFK